MSQSSNPNIALMQEIVKKILDYLADQKDINEEALKAYDPQPIQDGDTEIRKMRENEAIKLRDRVSEPKRHIAIIKRMYPDV